MTQTHQAPHRTPGERDHASAMVRLREEFARHRQEHDCVTGASMCRCGGWEGPYTLLEPDDERSYAAHLAQAVTVQIRQMRANAYASGYFEGAKARGSDYDFSLREFTSFPDGSETDPESVVRYVQALEQSVRLWEGRAGGSVSASGLTRLRWSIGRRVWAAGEAVVHDLRALHWWVRRP